LFAKLKGGFRLEVMTEERTIRPLDGGIAVGAYLRFLREARGMQVSEVAEAIGTNDAQVWRIEHWKSDTRSSLLFRFIKAVKGDANDVYLLINNPSATLEDGYKIAQLRLALN
jgi:transcriptional regulator with XRE-family HTH domain